MNVVRALLGAIGVGSALFGAGRQAARNKIDRELEQHIEAAAIEARTQIRQHTSSYLTQAWRSYFISCAVKSALLVGLITLVVLEVITRVQGAIIAGAVLLGGLAYDTITRRKEIAQIWTLIRTHGLKGQTILRTLVTKTVFEEVLSRAQEAKLTRLAQVVWSVSGYKRDEKYTMLATKVSETAATTAWRDIRPFLLVFGVRLFGIMVIYGAFAYSAVTWLTRS